MTRAAITVVLIALPDSVNPSLILGALYQAAGDRRTRRTAAFTAAAVLVTLAGGLLIAFGLADLVLSIVPKPSAELKYAVLAVVGLGLMVGGAVIFLRRRTISLRQSGTADRAARRGGSATAMGAGIAGIELLTAFPYFAAIAVIVGTSTSTGGRVALLVLYNVVYALPLIGIVAVCVAMGHRADAFLERMRTLAMTRWPFVAAPLAVAVGAGLAAYGVARL